MKHKSKLKNPFVLSAALSLGLHGSIAYFLIPSFLKIFLGNPVVFEMVWVDIHSEQPCHPELVSGPHDNKIPKQVRDDNLEPHNNEVLKQVQDDRVVQDDKVVRADNLEKTDNNTRVMPAKARITPHQPLPSYPWICRKRGQEGAVCLTVRTNKEGQVVDVSLCKSSGHSLLDDTALAAVKTWTLEEGNIHKTLVIAFRLEDKEVKIS